MNYCGNESEDLFGGSNRPELNRQEKRVVDVVKRTIERLRFLVPYMTWFFVVEGQKQPALMLQLDTKRMNTAEEAHAVAVLLVWMLSVEGFNVSSGRNITGNGTYSTVDIYHSDIPQELRRTGLVRPSLPGGHAVLSVR